MDNKESIEELEDKSLGVEYRRIIIKYIKLISLKYFEFNWKKSILFDISI